MKIHIKELHSHVAVLVPQEALYGEGFPMANTVKPCNTTGAINPFSSSLHLEDYSSNACVEAPFPLKITKALSYSCLDLPFHLSSEAIL